MKDDEIESIITVNNFAIVELNDRVERLEAEKRSLWKEIDLLKSIINKIDKNKEETK